MSKKAASPHPGSGKFGFPFGLGCVSELGEGEGQGASRRSVPSVGHAPLMTRFVWFHLLEVAGIVGVLWSWSVPVFGSP